MRDATLRECEQAWGDAKVCRTEELRGGDTSAVYRLHHEDGSTCIAKVQPPDNAQDRSAAEVDGLQWLASFETLRVPAVLGVTPSGVLLLEDLPPGRSSSAAPAAQAAFGEALAALHCCDAGTFGHRRDNYVGALHQSNRPADTWADFFAERRLAPLVETCVDRGALPASTRALLERLRRRLADLCAPQERPSPLHGDLWAGNVLWTAHGPAVIDPATYAGHREIDLAMMRLFGGFGPRVFDAYQSCAPLAPDHEDRVALFQLYPVLVHAVMFDGSGGGYASTALNILERYA